MRYHLLAAVVGGILGIGAASAAHASTVTFYYVSNPYTISNYGGSVDERPLMTTGAVTLDTDKLPGGGGVAGQRIVHYFDWEVYDWDEGSISTPGLVSYDFQNRTDWGMWSALDMTFNVFGRVDRWEVYNGLYPACFAECYGSRGDMTRNIGGFDAVYGMFGLEGFYFQDEERDRFLRDLGYRPHMSEYQEYFNDYALWYYRAYAPGQGMWFDTLSDFAAQIEVNTRLALANPPRSIYDIAPIPLPAPFALLLGGLGGLALLRRHARRPQRS